MVRLTGRSEAEELPPPLETRRGGRQSWSRCTTRNRWWSAGTAFVLSVKQFRGYKFTRSYSCVKQTLRRLLRENKPVSRLAVDVGVSGEASLLV